jgi:hypothetical protein
MYIEAPEGWHQFGTHVDEDVMLELSEETGEDGLPLWERVDPGCPYNMCSEREVANHEECLAEGRLMARDYESWSRL